MKKSLLALAIVVAATSANAATVYDKDGTTLAVGGRVQSVFYNGNMNRAGDHDATLTNSARLNINARTKVNDYFSAFAFSEWNMADGNSVTGESINTREQFVGADFGQYGKLTLGKTYDTSKVVYNATSGVVFDDWGGRAALNYVDRRPGQINYTYNNNGIYFAAAYQTAQDKIRAGSAIKKFNTGYNQNSDVEGGFSTTVGYTFDDVLFGPLSVKAFYSYLDGQNDAASLSSTRFLSKKDAGISFAWGSIAEGPYFAALYTRGEEKFQKGVIDTNSYDSSITYNGFELVGGYKTEFGLGAYVGYNALLVQNANHRSESFNVRRVPAYVTYNPTPNILIYSEAEFDADSSYKASQKGYDLGTIYSVGARYTF